MEAAKRLSRDRYVQALGDGRDMSKPPQAAGVSFGPSYHKLQAPFFAPCSVSLINVLHSPPHISG